VETSEGLPTWKWFPRAPARALVLISVTEYRLEKLSSGRVRWSSSHPAVQQHWVHWAASERTSSLLIQSSNAQRSTQDRESRDDGQTARQNLDNRAWEQYEVVTQQDSVRKLRNQMGFRGVSTLYHRDLPADPRAVSLESGDDGRPTRQHKDSFVPQCHAGHHGALHMHRALCEIMFQEKYLAVQKLFKYVCSRSESFFGQPAESDQGTGVH